MLIELHPIRCKVTIVKTSAIVAPTYISNSQHILANVSDSPSGDSTPTPIRVAQQISGLGSPVLPPTDRSYIYRTFTWYITVTNGVMYTYLASQC